MFVFESNAKGAIAEQAIVLAAAKLHVPVWKPVSEHSRADLMFEIGGRLHRVQVKWGRLSERGDVVIARIGTSRHSPNGYVRTTYADHEVDLFAIYCGELDRRFLLPMSQFAGMNQIHLRLSPARNSQLACINLADSFDFEGAIAQLGERLHGMQEAAGSSPASSTETHGPAVIGCEELRERLGVWIDRVAAGEEVLVTRRGKPRIRLIPASDELGRPSPVEPDRPRLDRFDAQMRLAPGVAGQGGADGVL